MTTGRHADTLGLSSMRLSTHEDAAFIPNTPAALEAVQAHFTGARAHSEVFERAKAAFIAEGLTPANALFGSSICPDEINHAKGGLSTLLGEYLEEQFFLGGLAGVPFVGKTGFGAFAAHVPIGGHMVVHFASHVAISANGEVGLLQRLGQGEASHACGAAIAAYKRIEKEKADGLQPVSDPFDAQMDWIVSHLRMHSNQLLETESSRGHNALSAAIALETYRMIQEYIDHISFPPPGGKLVLLGGVDINMPGEHYLLPLLFQVRSGPGDVKDLLATLL